MAKDFWFKFFPDAWLSDESLVSCTLGAQGAFMRMLCFMSKSSERGYLLCGSVVPSLEMLCRMVGCWADVLKPIIAELVSASVLSEDERKAIDGTPLYYSKRMVRDSELSGIRSTSGSQGGRPKKQNESKTKANTKAKRKQISNSNSNSKDISNSESDVRELNPRNLIWDVTAELWFGGNVIASQRARCGKVVKDFKELGATESEIRFKHNQQREEWGDNGCTPESLVKHWHSFGPNRKAPGNSGSLFGKAPTEADSPARIRAKPGKYDNIKYANAPRATNRSIDGGRNEGEGNDVRSGS